MKVVHLVPGFGIGGTEKQVLLLVSHMDRTRFSNRVWGLKGWGPLGEKLRKAGVPAKTLGGGGVFSSLRLVAQLTKWLKVEQPDIVHTWLTPANIIGRLSTRFYRDCALINSLRVVEGEKLLHTFLERWTNSMTKAVTVNCQALHRFAAEKLRMPESKLHLIPNGIEEPVSKPTGPPSGIPESWLRPPCLLVGSAGRLENQKGFRFLLEAFQKLLTTHPQARLVIAGEGSLRKELERQVSRFHLENEALLCGNLTDMASFLGCLRIFVLPSLWEGFPNVIMEAMAHGVPVVATDVGGVKELVTPESGTLVPPGDPKALAEGIEKTICNLDEAHRRAQIASAVVRREYSIERTVQMTASLYEKLARAAK